MKLIINGSICLSDADGVNATDNVDYRITVGGRLAGLVDYALEVLERKARENGVPTTDNPIPGETGQQAPFNPSPDDRR